MILKRLGQGLLVLLVLETVTFFLIRLLPGHPFMGEKKLPEHVLQQLQTSYGLDQSSLVQYGRYWWNMLVHGDLGPSLVKEGISVADMIGQSFPVSLQLGVIGMVISILVGIPAGIVAALYKNRWMDWWVMLVSMGRHLYSRLRGGSAAGCGAGHACARPERCRMGFSRLRGAACADAGIGECRVPSAPDARRHA